MTKSNAKKARLHSARKQRATAPARSEAQPRTTEAIYEAMARSFATTLGSPRRCGDKACRRARRCVGRNYRCGRDDAAAEPPTPEQEAEFQALLREGLQKRLAEFKEQREEQARGGTRGKG